ncbi:tripartite tricarboxylate transporter substrate binding protein [Variovorax sp. Sphag1AA]|uniref:Bug family tripartite tricarboxylate transporter substrate binding protein n=1 Tax=Variovorax sp. Sphag1AA TaxID=2587027 RepID=UPI001621E21C|nr:tripartite tricarboxylate transporter substrate binding protein [Variovorax sp. Sphag1AA]MBB3180935.1 tripartite-type tricarboxylate transporter receptor subunit TctC [Variovorax sp. Sphag1AA]
MRTGLAAAIAAPLPQIVSAQDARPTRPVTLVCPYPAGGLGDSTARTLAKGLGELWKVPVVVDNKSGATGMIGAATVAKGPGDGTLLLCMLPEALSVAKALNAPLGFEVITDLQPVALSVVSGCVLGVNAKGRFRSYQDLVDHARANPGSLNFGVQGTGSAFHLAAERWALAENIRITTVPYKGGAPALTDLLGGQLDAMFLATSLGLPYFQSKQLRPVAIASRERIEDLRDVRTLIELGLPDFEVPITLGVFAPGATPQPRVQALNKDMRQVMHETEARTWMQKNLVSTTELSDVAFRERMVREIAVFTEVAARSNIKLS